MTDWTVGYVTDIPYTHGYYAELNPLRTRLALLNQGLVPPKVEAACELGFGQGLSVNLHAAATAVRWWGTDFNPTQAGFARELAAVSGANAQLFDDAFADFAQRCDLPDFDAACTASGAGFRMRTAASSSTLSAASSKWAGCSTSATTPCRAGRPLRRCGIS